MTNSNHLNTIACNTNLVPFILDRGFERKEAIFLWGKPGIGKSTLIRNWVLSKGPDWDFHDVRLTTLEPQDLRGLPDIDRNTRRTIWNLPEFIPSGKGSEKRFGVIFLDELTAADSRMQASAYELINERRIGGKPIPENYWVCAAGNSVDDVSISFEMGAALSDRFQHVHVQADPTTWLNWASENKIDPSVLTYIRLKADHLEGNSKAQQDQVLITPTPRSWERVSNILKQKPSKDIPAKLADQILKTEVYGQLGNEVAASFFSVLEEVSGLPDIPTLLKSKKEDQIKMVPDTLPSFYGLTYSTVAYANDLKGLQSVMKLFENLCSVEDTNVPRDDIRTLAVEALFKKSYSLGLLKSFIKTKEYAPYASKIAELNEDL